MKNTWLAKIRRNLTSFLPISKKRKGQCINCGVCCSLPNKCFFLRNNHCVIYKIRPLTCRKYPRTKAEFITPETCGYYFED